MTRCRRSVRSLWSFLTVLALLAGYPSASTAQREADASFESHLGAMAKKGSHGPIVATLHAPESPSSARAQYDSLDDLARDYGLTLLKQDRINVIGPAERVDFGPLFDGSLPVQRSLDSLSMSLLMSLTEEQWLAMGSPVGLPFSALTPDQQLLVIKIFNPNSQLIRFRVIGKDEMEHESLPAENVRPETVTLSAWLNLDIPRVVAEVPDEDFPSWTIGYFRPVLDQFSDWYLTDRHEPGKLIRRHSTTVPGKLVANTLKESHLDYSLPALRAPLPFSGRISLKELVEQAKKKSGLDLRASPGAENVFLYVHAANVEAGKLLKAVSLATTGTWRKFDQSYVFTVDLAGIGQISAAMAERVESPLASQLSKRILVDTLRSRPDLLSAFSVQQDARFSFTSDQITTLFWKTINGESSKGIPWATLSSDQQTALRKLCEEDGKWKTDRSELLDSGLWMVTSTMSLRVAFLAPDVGRVLPEQDEDGNGLQFGIGPHSEAEEFTAMITDAPGDLRVPLNTKFRALMCDPSSREKPSTLVSNCARHGFNAIFLRVFTDGYTAFPSKQFPMMPKLKEDYLPEVVSSARSKGLKVYGVVDVLRWSDGSPKHWLAKRTDLLDYNIFGLTNSQWANSLVLSDLERGLAELFSGNALKGELVSPFHPDVEAKLTKMLEELSAYGLDGLVLDHISQSYAFIHMMSDPRGSSGILGHNPIARKTFFEAHGADSVDIPDNSPYLDLFAYWGSTFPHLGTAEFPGSSLYPIVRACRNLTSEWTRRHGEKTTDLVCTLTKRWSDLEQTGPVWLVDESAGGLGRLDWSKLKDQTDHVVYPILRGGPASPTSVGAAMVHGSDHLGTMFFALMLAEGLGYKFSFATPELYMDGSAKEGVVIDLRCAPRKKAAYLRILAPPEPDWEKKKAVEAE